MEMNETTILDDRGFIKINGDEAKSFLQNIVTNDIEKITGSLTLFSSIFTPQGKYLYEFFILKFEDGYLLECEKKLTSEIIKIFDFYKLRTKVNLIDVSKKYTNIIISLEKFKKITKTQHMEDSTLSCEEGSTLSCENERIYVDPRSKNLGAKIITKIENIVNTNISSEGLIKGVIQIPPDGNPIIMLSDHGTIGGYPKIGVIISADYDRLVQLTPGSKIKFKLVELSEAETLFKLYNMETQKILVPVFLGLPRDANHFAPLLRIVGTTAIVSTLFTIVGQP